MQFFTSPLGILCTIGAGVWLITIINRNTGEVDSRYADTSQDRDELMKRNASALTKRTGKPTESKRVRNGFWNWNDDVSVNGQKKKK